MHLLLLRGLGQLPCIVGHGRAKLLIRNLSGGKVRLGAAPGLIVNVLLLLRAQDAVLNGPGNLLLVLFLSGGRLLLSLAGIVLFSNAGVLGPVLRL